MRWLPAALLLCCRCTALQPPKPLLLNASAAEEQEGSHYCLMVTPQSGLGNRLRVALSAMVFAERYPGTNLAMQWLPDKHMPAEFNSLFSGHPFQDTCVDGVPVQHCDCCKNWMDKECPLKDDGTKVPRKCCGNLFLPGPLHEDTHIKACHNFGPGNPGDMSEDQYQQRFAAAFSRLTVSTPIAEMIGTHVSKLMAPDKTVIGVHVRQGDGMHKKPPKQFQKPISVFFEAIDAALGQEREADSPDNTVIFLSTDTKEVQQEFYSKYGDKVVWANNIDGERVQRESAQDIAVALIDMVLLSKSSIVIGTEGSSFSQVAAMLSGQNKYTPVAFHLHDDGTDEADEHGEATNNLPVAVP